MRNIILLNIFFLCFGILCFGQNIPDPNFAGKLEQKQLSAKKAADQLTNFKSIVTDLLTNRYYQALIKNGVLKQNDGEIQIKSTIYGLIRIFDTTVSERKYFEKNRLARNITIGAGAILGDENKITSLNSSLTIALLNKREYKGSTNLFDKNSITAESIEAATVFVDKAFDAVEKKINDKLSSEEYMRLSVDEKKEFKKKYEEEVMKPLNDFSVDIDFDKLKGLINDDEIAQSKAMWGSLCDKYDNIQKKLSGAPLLTYNYEGNYNGDKWSKLNNRIEFIVGFGNKKDSIRKYDFYAGLFYEMGQDTLNQSGNLNRNVFNAKIGINNVLWRDKSDGSSIIEAFGGAEFQKINKGLYNGEKTNALKLDVTLSFRVAKKLYLPFQVKYNAASGKFEGYLDLKFDIVNVF